LVRDDTATLASTPPAAAADLMGIAHRYIAAANLIAIVWDGTVTAGEWTAAARRQIADANWAQARSRLIDARTADTASLTAPDAGEISAILERAHPNVAGVRLAIVANQGREIARYAEHRSDTPGVTTIVFNDVATACAWLDVDMDVILETIRDLRRELRAGVIRPAQPDGSADAPGRGGGGRAAE
jgi:hypothetical protein